MAMSVQVLLCGLIWTSVGFTTINKIIPLPDKLALWLHKNSSETNMLITVISTVLGTTGSFLLGITVQHALTFRLSRELQLSVLTAWIQLARNSLFFQPRRHLRWTLLSGLWVGAINFLITAWSSLLTPELVVLRLAGAGRELDFFNPAISNYTPSLRNLPPLHPTAHNYTLISDNITLTRALMGDLHDAGRSAAKVSIDTRHPEVFSEFKFSTGGVLPAAVDNSRLGPKQAKASIDFHGLNLNYRGLFTTYTLVQQGYTANVSCMMSHSPAIILNNTASLKQTFETPSGHRVHHTLQTWSWSTNCSGNGEYYTGEVNVMASDHNDHNGHGKFTKTGLLATSVCFYQDFSGPSNKSFLVLIQPSSNSSYSSYYSASVASRHLHTVCQVTPMITTVEIQYDESGTGSVRNVLDQVPLPNDVWHLVVFPGLEIWKTYVLAQSLYSNTMADDIMGVGRHNIMPILEQYLRGIIEYLGTRERGVATYSLTRGGQVLPKNMTIPFGGTMNVHTMGWTFHLRTHGISLAVITLVTIVTTASGIYALMEANRQQLARDTFRKDSMVALDPTNLMDVLVASSTGSLASALSQCEFDEDRENLWVGLGMVEGQSALNVR